MARSILSCLAIFALNQITCMPQCYDAQLTAAGVLASLHVTVSVAARERGLCNYITAHTPCDCTTTARSRAFLPSTRSRSCLPDVAKRASVSLHGQFASSAASLPLYQKRGLVRNTQRVQKCKMGEREGRNDTITQHKHHLCLAVRPKRR